MADNRFVLGQRGHALRGKVCPDFLTETADIQTFRAKLATQVAKVAGKGNGSVKAIIFFQPFSQLSGSHGAAQEFTIFLADQAFAGCTS
ncbi:MAG: hypothetical protein WBW55_07975 [Desulfobaccales bacterium]|jgi:hypothetical protein